MAELEQQVEAFEEQGKNKLGAIGHIGGALEQYPQLNEMAKPLIAAVAGWLNKSQGAPAATKTDIPPITADVSTQEGIDRTGAEAMGKLMVFYRTNYGEDKGDAILAQDLAKLANITDDPEDIYGGH